MKSPAQAILLFLSLSHAMAQEAASPAATAMAPTVEPGLEQAVKWRWQPEETAPSAWGLQIEVKKPELPPQPVTAPVAAPTAAPAVEPPKPAPLVKTAPTQALDHTIGRGDTLGVIARRYTVTVDQIKKFNNMTTDKILVGKKLRIPGVDDIKAMTPPPPAPAPSKEATAPAQPTPEQPKAEPPPPAPPKKARAETLAELLIAKKPRRSIPAYAWGVASLVRMQVFLDRQGYGIGPIDGMPGSSYNTAYEAFNSAYPGRLFSSNATPSEELKSVGGAFVEYTLRDEDLRWIAYDPAAQPVSGGKSKSTTPPAPTLTLDSLTSQPFLAYRSAWEFVAERFHASEAFLRRINPSLKNAESPGAVFLVPNVLPFEIENAFTDLQRPAADPAAPVKAVVVGRKRLIISKGDQVVAHVPFSVARPDLRGRGNWVILEHLSRPRLISTGSESLPLSTPVVLPPGPNNPVGLAWIHLAKASDLKPLPFGLHGTSIPGSMNKQESVGGFRLTNWDLLRVLRLLPIGTELTWQ